MFMWVLIYYPSSRLHEDNQEYVYIYDYLYIIINILGYIILVQVSLLHEELKYMFMWVLYYGIHIILVHSTSTFY